MFVGYGNTSGHLVAAGGANPDEWPVFNSWYVRSRGIHVGGSSGDNRSSVDINGFKINNTHYTDVNSTTMPAADIMFKQYFSIVNLDNINFDPSRANLINKRGYVELLDCTDSVLGDTTWETLDFANDIDSGNAGYNIDASGTNCDALFGAIEVDGTGLGTGSIYENDPNGIVSWIGEDECLPLTGNCDGDAANGCETPLNTVDNCGACGVVCDLPNATNTCEDETCQIQSCDADTADCDGVAANGCEAQGVGAACDNGALGVCYRSGVMECSEGGGGLACNADDGSDGATDEMCDNLDNDCNGQTDEGYLIGDPCSVGAGACEVDGVLVCNAAGDDTECNAQPGAAGVELCGTSVDENCNGETDEGFDVGAPCSVGEGECRAEGEMVCIPDGSGTTCDAVDVCVDVIPPEVPTAWNMTPPSTSWSNDVTPEISGEAPEDGSIVRIFLEDDCVTELGHGTTNGGAFSISAFTLAAVDANNKYYYTIEDSAGNVTFCAYSGLWYLVDLTAPPAPSVSVLGRNPTGRARPSWTWASSPVYHYRFAVDNPDLSGETPELGARTFTASHDLPIGDHILYVQAQDRAGNWSPLGSATVTINSNNIPTISHSDHANVNNFSGSGELNDRYAFDIDRNTAVGEVSFALSDLDGGTPSFVCNSNPAWVTVDGAGNKITFSPVDGDEGIGMWMNCQADDGVDLSDPVYLALDVFEDGCLWTGATDTNWSTASNWSNCGGNVPTSTEAVIVTDTPVNQPTVNANAQIDHFAIHTGGGTVTLTNNHSLRIVNSTNAISSSITFEADSPTCGNCKAYSDGHVEIVHRAVATFGRGVRFEQGSFKYIYVGRSGTTGHMYADAGSDENEWAKIGNQFYPIVANGVSREDHSTLYFNGVKLRGGYQSSSSLKVGNYVTIENFDNVSTTAYQESYGWREVLDIDTRNSTTNDYYWDNIIFNNFSLQLLGYHFHWPITIAGSGAGYGEFADQSSSGSVTWVDGASATCVWNGSIDSDWENPSNWDDCTNNRNNYPDQNDFVDVRDVGFQPTMTNSQGVAGFVGTGGGTITISPSTTLHITRYNNTDDRVSFEIASDITFQGATPNCSNCMLVQESADVAIVHNATLTLGRGVRFRSFRSNLFVGYNNSPGHLVVNGGDNPDEWPEYDTTSAYSRGIQIEGFHSSYRSSVSIDGFRITNTHNSDYQRPVADLMFNQYFDIVNLDNINFNPMGTNLISKRGYIELLDCTNSVLGDTIWDGLDFDSDIDSADNGHNIDASGTDCDDFFGTIDVYGTGLGTGAAYENDPNGIINWP